MEKTASKLYGVGFDKIRMFLMNRRPREGPWQHVEYLLTFLAANYCSKFSHYEKHLVFLRDNLKRTKAMLTSKTMYWDPVTGDIPTMKPLESHAKNGVVGSKWRCNDDDVKYCVATGWNAVLDLDVNRNEPVNWEGIHYAALLRPWAKLVHEGSRFQQVLYDICDDMEAVMIAREEPLTQLPVDEKEDNDEPVSKKQRVEKK